MNGKTLNPYEVPASNSIDHGKTRFRLRRWFALALYLSLFLDFITIWTFGLQPFLLSIGVFMVSLVLSVILRKFANVRVDETGIRYADFVQSVEIPWGQIVRVVHTDSKTVVGTRHPLAQVTLSRHHHAYDTIVAEISANQLEHGFGIEGSSS